MAWLRAIAVGTAILCAQALAAQEAPSRAIALPAAAEPAAAVVDAFHAALRRGDTAAALGFLADDVLILESGGVERSKAEYAAEHLGADAEYAQAATSILARRTASVAGDMAWIASEGRSTGTFRGKAFDRVTAETMVLLRVGTKWQIKHIHWSSAAAPAARFEAPANRP